MKDLKTIIYYLAVLTIIIGVLGIAGWLLATPVLYSFLSNGASMKFITSLLTVLIGVSAFCLNKGDTRVAQVLAAVVLLVGAITLLEHLFTIDLKIDNLLYTDHVTNPQLEAPGRMSIYASITVVLISVGLWLSSFKHFFAAQIILLLEFILLYSALLGVLFNITGLFNFGHYSAVAFPTATSLLFVTLALLFYSSKEGYLKEIFNRYSAAATARYAIAYFLIVTPLFVGVFMLVLAHTAVPPKLAVVLLIMSTAILTVPFAFLALKRLNKADEKLHQLTQQLRRNSLQLAEKNIELTNMNKEMDNIIHMVSHDLKTPIMSLQGSLDILRRKLSPKADEKDIQLFTIPQRSVKRLKETIESVSRLLKAQRPERERLEEIDICNLIDDIKTELHSVITDSQATFTVQLTNCVLIYERLNLHSILQNLISNAIKYHQPGRPPVIHITNRIVEDGTQVIIQDNGLGIPQQAQADLFTKYKRFHEHVEGTGVGLYLTKQLIEAGGGDISVKSQEGEGSTFTLFFPAVPPGTKKSKA